MNEEEETKTVSIDKLKKINSKEMKELMRSGGYLKGELIDKCMIGAYLLTMLVKDGDVGKILDDLNEGKMLDKSLEALANGMNNLDTLLQNALMYSYSLLDEDKCPVYFFMTENGLPAMIDKKKWDVLQSRLREDIGRFYS